MKQAKQKRRKKFRNSEKWANYQAVRLENYHKFKNIMGNFGNYCTGESMDFEKF